MIPDLLGQLTRRGMARRVLQNVLEGFASPSRDFPGALCRADGYVFAGTYSAFANRAGRRDRMQGHEINRSLAGAFGHASGALKGSLTNISGAAADIPCRAVSPG